MTKKTCQTCGPGNEIGITKLKEKIKIKDHEDQF